MRLRGPLADSYVSAVALVVFALTPYLALSTALAPVTPMITKSLGMSRQSFELTLGMANAAYAFGTVAAVQFQVRLRGRRMLVLYATLLVAGSVLAAAARTPALFITGHVLQGLCTSLMLIAAVPPLVIGWPSSRMPWTGATMNMCIFGAVALGPVIGGVQAGANDWRPLFWIVAAFAAVALLFSLLTFEDQEPQDKSAPWDWVAQSLAGLGCAAAFFLAGFSLRSELLPRVFALVELLRGVAAFMIAPVLMHLAQTVGGNPAAGTKTAIWVCFGIAAGGALVAAYIVLLGRARLQRPDLERWLGGEGGAIDSPPLAARVRGKRQELALGRR